MTTPEELRDVLAEALIENYPGPDRVHYEIADALLSGPLAPLLAAQAAVERVEVLAAKYDRRPPIRSQFAIPTGELRVALDGTP